MPGTGWITWPPGTRITEAVGRAAAGAAGAEAFFSTGLSSFQIMKVRMKATPPAISSWSRYRGTLLTAGMAGMPVTP